MTHRYLPFVTQSLLGSLVGLALAGCQQFPILEQILTGDDSYNRTFLMACTFGSSQSDANCAEAARKYACASHTWDASSRRCDGQMCVLPQDRTSDLPNGFVDFRGNSPASIHAVARCDDSAIFPVAPRTAALKIAPSPSGIALSPQATTVAAPTAAASLPSIAEFPLPRTGSQPGPIIVADGTVVFGELAPCAEPCTQETNVAFATIDPAGTIVERGIPAQNADRVRTGLAPRPGASGVCYGETHRFLNGSRSPDKLVCINTTNSVLREYTTASIGGTIVGLAPGVDGRIWYVDGVFDAVTAVDTGTWQRSSAYLDVGRHLGLAAITGGPDGAMWFTAVGGNMIGRIATDSVGLKVLPTPDAQPTGIVAGPDGALWFTELKAGKIGRITPQGDVTEYPLPTADAQPLGIAAGPDGALWFTEFKGNKIGRITVRGEITEYDLPTADAQPAGIVAGPDGSLWFTEVKASKIGRLATGILNYQGLWWAAPAGSESGWGINFAHQGDIVFATWFTFDAIGKPRWLIAQLERTAQGVYAGPVSTVTGPPFGSTPFEPTKVVERIVGNATVTFADVARANFTYTVDGRTRTRALVPQEFPQRPSCTWATQADLRFATNYTDLWWNAGESGWGINFSHQGDVVFATWFTYDATGNPWWLVADLRKSGAGVYSGSVATVTGPPFDADPYDPSKVIETTVGSATTTFANGNSASFAYTVDGVTQTKTITRQVFVPPGTVCH